MYPCQNLNLRINLAILTPPNVLSKCANFFNKNLQIVLVLLILLLGFAVDEFDNEDDINIFCVYNSGK
jgi:hypothetical protein